MSEHRVLDAAHDLKGKTVIGSANGERFGQVEEVIVHPTKGTVLGLVLRDETGAVGVLAAQDVVVGHDAIMAVKGARPQGIENQTPFREGVLASALVGSAVITENGNALGRISDVLVSIDRPIVIYRVAESTIKRFFGGGFYVPGSVATTISDDGKRIIVPANADDQYAFATLDEALAGKVKEVEEVEEAEPQAR